MYNAPIARIGVFFVFLLVSASYTGAFAQTEKEKPKRATDVIVSELALGSFSAAVGWGASALVTAPWRDARGCQEDSSALRWCVLAMVTGPSLAALVGVIAIGDLSGVHGNTPFALLGSVVSSFSLFSCLVEPTGVGRTIWCQAVTLGGFGVIILPTLLVTVGYNLTARMKTELPADSPVSLLLLNTRF
jgi:hypothetical protein